MEKKEKVMKKLGMVMIIGAWILWVAFPVSAQQPEQVDPGQGVTQGQAGPDDQNMDVKTYVELMRTDLRAQKKQILSQSMGLDDAQAKAFWPIYNDYEHDLSKLNDKGIEIIKDYAKNYENMQEKTAKDIMNRSLDLQAEKLKLRKVYAKKMEKALSAKVAARFLQIDNVVNKMIELQIDSKLPLIK